VPFKALASSLYGGKYTIGKFLGRGASASVWEAHHEHSRLRVAVKVFDQGSKDKKQAHRELRILARVQHPRILEALEVVETAHCAHLVCGFVDAETLRAFTQKQAHGRIREDTARGIFLQIADGVNFCHDRLVAHRDLKLENLLLDRERQTIKIIDFGFAAQVVSKDTKLKAFCGTPSYMAPEIIRGEGYSGFAADIWALGVVLFAMLAGSLPFTARTEMALYAKIRRGTFSCPDAIAELPRRLVKGALRVEAATRPSVGVMLRHQWLFGSTASLAEIVCASSSSVSSSAPAEEPAPLPVPSSSSSSFLAPSSATNAERERACGRRASTGGSSMGGGGSEFLPVGRESGRRYSSGYMPSALLAADTGDTGGTDDKLLASSTLLTASTATHRSAANVKILPPGPAMPLEAQLKAFQPPQRPLGARTAYVLGGS